MKTFFIIIGAVWLFEAIYITVKAIKAYRDDVKRYGKDAANIIWRGRR